MSKIQVGLMLTKEMYSRIEEISTWVDFFQVPAEEYFGETTIEDFAGLEFVSKYKPVHIHSIDLSIGSFNGINEGTISNFLNVENKFDIVTYSDHIGFSKAGKVWTGMAILNPSLTKESADQMIDNIKEIKKTLNNKPFYIENNSHCIDWPNSKMSDAEFMNYVASESGSGLLLDIPNMIADAKNYNFDAKEFISSLDPKLVKMVHITGGDWLDGFREKRIARGHNRKVEKDTWELLEYTVKNLKPEYVVLERIRLVEYKEIEEDLRKLKEIIKICQ